MHARECLTGGVHVERIEEARARLGARGRVRLAVVEELLRELLHALDGVSRYVRAHTLSARS
jgi:hypothetical protein